VQCGTELKMARGRRPDVEERLMFGSR
jgi:hypothetical protein